MCRCGFIQPEVSTATCTVPPMYLSSLITAKNVVAQRFPGAPECGVLQKGAVPQVSGRMAPYVIEEAQLGDICKWGFLNACKTKIVFIYTDASGPQLLTLTKAAMAMLKAYMPRYSACVYDDAMSCFKITAAPTDEGGSNDANKNTCLIVYGDGAIRLQGTPSKMLRPCECFRVAVLTIAESKSWTRFLRNLDRVDINQASGENEVRSRMSSHAEQ